MSKFEQNYDLEPEYDETAPDEEAIEKPSLQFSNFQIAMLIVVGIFFVSRIVKFVLRARARNEHIIQYSGKKDTKGRYHGKGILKMKNGDEYTGMFCHGIKKGRGVYTFKQGTSYTGDFDKGLFCGNGRETYAGNMAYEGEFKDGMRHGTGKFTYKSGAWFQGSFENGKKNGLGVHVFADQNRFVGMYVAGKREGAGVHITHLFPEFQDKLLVLASEGGEALPDYAQFTVKDVTRLTYVTYAAGEVQRLLTEEEVAQFRAKNKALIKRHTNHHGLAYKNNAPYPEA